MRDYRIVVEENTLTLEGRVRMFLAEGWDCLGGMQATVVIDKPTYKVFFSQTLIKREKEDKTNV